MTAIALTTPSGIFVGFEEHGIHKCLGIRYAQPPVDNLRFKPPVPVEPSDGPVDARQFGNRNLQVGMAEEIYGEFVPPGKESEDCLFLNVFAPPLGEQPKAVIVWIHGGAFTSGSGNEYDPTRIVATNDVIVVTINYRLGVFGFVDFRGLGAGFDDSVNLGMQDQILALRWVQDNIASFGGDPDNVSIWGESAGGTSVLTLMGMPEATGLFHKIGAFSGAETLGPPIDHLPAIKLHLGAQGTHDIREKLVSMTAAELSAMQQNVPLFAGPCLDGKHIALPSCEAIKQGMAAGIPVVAGTVRDEGTLLAPLFAVSEEATQMTLAGLATSIGRDMGEAYFAYLAAEHAENSSLERLTRAWFDLFRASALRVAATATEYGAGGWVYNFEVETDHPLGVTHFSDIPFTFDWLQDAYPLSSIHEATDANKALAKAWSQTLIAFAKSGEPNGADLPKWPNYKPNEFECLRIRQNPDVVSNPDGNMLSVYKVI